MKYTYQTKGTCSKIMELEIDQNDIIQDIKIIGGCNGNIQGLIKLVKGQNAKEVAQKLEGIDLRCTYDDALWGSRTPCA